jgi:hypothetical protein
MPKQPLPHVLFAIAHLTGGHPEGGGVELFADSQSGLLKFLQFIGGAAKLPVGAIADLDLYDEAQWDLLKGSARLGSAHLIKTFRVHIISPGASPSMEILPGDARVDLFAHAEKLKIMQEVEHRRHFDYIERDRSSYCTGEDNGLIEGQRNIAESVIVQAFFIITAQLAPLDPLAIL